MERLDALLSTFEAADGQNLRDALQHSLNLPRWPLPILAVSRFTSGLIGRSVALLVHGTGSTSRRWQLISADQHPSSGHASMLSFLVIGAALAVQDVEATQHDDSSAEPS